jgi:hypothetical protein
MATTRADYDRVRRQSRRDLMSGHVYWEGAVSGSGAPRTTLKGKYVDARRIIWEYVNGGDLPAYTRLRSLCGNPLCLADGCVSYIGDGMAPEDFVTWQCSCGNSVRVLPLANGAWCSGLPGSAHAPRGMRRVSESPLRASEEAPGIAGRVGA